MFTLENGAKKFLQNDGNHLPNYTESDSRRPGLNIPFSRVLNLMLVLLVLLVAYRARCCIVMAGTGEERGQSWRVTSVHFKYTQKRTVGWRNNPFPLSLPSSQHFPEPHNRLRPVPSIYTIIPWGCFSSYLLSMLL